MDKITVTLTKDQAQFLIATLQVANRDTENLKRHLSEQGKQNEIAYNTRIITKLQRELNELEIS